jgi:hypothetical protein
VAPAPDTYQRVFTHCEQSYGRPLAFGALPGDVSFADLVNMRHDALAAAQAYNGTRTALDPGVTVAATGLLLQPDFLELTVVEPPTSITTAAVPLPAHDWLEFRGLRAGGYILFATCDDLDALAATGQECSCLSSAAVVHLGPGRRSGLGLSAAIRAADTWAPSNAQHEALRPGNATAATRMRMLSLRDVLGSESVSSTGRARRGAPVAAARAILDLLQRSAPAAHVQLHVALICANAPAARQGWVISGWHVTAADVALTIVAAYVALEIGAWAWRHRQNFRVAVRAHAGTTIWKALFICSDLLGWADEHLRVVVAAAAPSARRAVHWVRRKGVQAGLRLLGMLVVTPPTAGLVALQTAGEHRGRDTGKSQHKADDALPTKEKLGNWSTSRMQ